MTILPIYASLLAILFVVLSLRIVGLRRRFKIIIGDADNELVRRAIRVHANFSEYVPLGLMMIYLVEVCKATPILVHILGLSLFLGRLIHAYGVSQTDENVRWRISGMSLTFATLLISGSYLLLSYTGLY
ncbi:MAG: MAPEG family protein [Pseudanabaena sp. ELA607]